MRKVPAPVTSHRSGEYAKVPRMRSARIRMAPWREESPVVQNNRPYFLPLLIVRSTLLAADAFFTSIPAASVTVMV